MFQDKIQNETICFRKKKNKYILNELYIICYIPTLNEDFWKVFYVRQLPNDVQEVRLQIVPLGIDSRISAPSSTLAKSPFHTKFP